MQQWRNYSWDHHSYKTPIFQSPGQSLRSLRNGPQQNVLKPSSWLFSHPHSCGPSASLHILQKAVFIHRMAYAGYLTSHVDGCSGLQLVLSGPGVRSPGLYAISTTYLCTFGSSSSFQEWTFLQLYVEIRTPPPSRASQGVSQCGSSTQNYYTECTKIWIFANLWTMPHFLLAISACLSIYSESCLNLSNVLHPRSLVKIPSTP